jgi:hypothetical protein
MSSLEEVALAVLAGFAEVAERVLWGLGAGASVACLLTPLRDLEGLIGAAVGSTELEAPALPASTWARFLGRGASSSECSVKREGLAQTSGKQRGLTGSAGARGALRA